MVDSSGNIEFNVTFPSAFDMVFFFWLIFGVEIFEEDSLSESSEIICW